VRQALGCSIRAGGAHRRPVLRAGQLQLPIASRGAQVLGVEGSAQLVRRAEDNARANGLGAQARFQAANLFEEANCAQFGAGGFDKLLIDPPRDGAVEVVKALGDDAPRRIVYVSAIRRPWRATPGCWCR